MMLSMRSARNLISQMLIKSGCVLLPVDIFSSLPIIQFDLLLLLSVHAEKILTNGSNAFVLHLAVLFKIIKAY